MAREFGLIATLFPLSTSEEELYVCPVGIQIVGTLTICNQDSSERSFSLAQCFHTGAAGNEEWKFRGKKIPANDTLQLSGVTLKEGQTLKVQVSTGSTISFLFEGMKLT